MSDDSPSNDPDKLEFASLFLVGDYHCIRQFFPDQVNQPSQKSLRRSQGHTRRISHPLVFRPKVIILSRIVFFSLITDTHGLKKIKRDQYTYSGDMCFSGFHIKIKSLRDFICPSQILFFFFLVIPTQCSYRKLIAFIKSPSRQCCR